ncbi:MAG TPA: gamma-glutamyltransferase family protein [Thermoanaerobaculia bacterium]|nr:gamma-glutamyltransferase family protein [Thermoanaerobaculia bacterium]
MTPTAPSLALLVLLAAPVGLAQQAPAPKPIETIRPEITAARGIVAGGRNFSVAAGLRMLERGGNAVDAGVAAVFAASVVEISHFGFGGECPLMIYDAKTKKVVVVNGQGPAPKAASPDLFKEKGKVDGNGPLAATVPAVMDALAIALAEYGTMRLEEVMAPAIAYADGFPMYAFLRGYLVRERKATEKWEWSKKTYYPDGRIPEVGETFRQPNLAKTLREIVAAERAAFEKTRDRKAAILAGRDAFYKGSIAWRIAEADRAAGGVLAYDDLAGFRGRVEEPVKTTFHGYDVFKAGPWDQGPVLLQTFNILEGIDLAAMGPGSADAIHAVHEAIKLAYDDRNAYYGDPDFVKVPLKGLLSADYAAARRKLIGPEAFLEHRPGDPFAFDPDVKAPAVRYAPHSQGEAPRAEKGDTTCVDAVDGAGNLFSATPSSGWLLGGAFIAGDTGVPLSNRMQIFDLDPASPNVLAGGKRPRTTLTPTILVKDGKPYLAISTPGGDSQDQQIANVLLNLIVFRMGLQEAIEFPRINSLHPFSSFDDHKSEPCVLEIESRIPAATLEELKRRGHKLKVLAPYGMPTGVVAVGVDPQTGTLRGGADVRRERTIFGW